RRWAAGAARLIFEVGEYEPAAVGVGAQLVKDRPPVATGRHLVFPKLLAELVRVEHDRTARDEVLRSCGKFLDLGGGEQRLVLLLARQDSHVPFTGRVRRPGVRGR